MFPVAKKPGSDPPVRIILNLEPLNAITVQDAALVTDINEFAESFVGYAIYGIADLYSGFDAVTIHPNSRALQAFHTPIGPRQQTTMGQGYSNAPQEFERRVGHTLKPVGTEVARGFFDDCGCKGPRSRYDDAPITGNLQIRRFVWEYAQNLDAFLSALIQAGVTASGMKTTLAVYDLHIVGSVVSLEGWKIAPSLVQRVLDWPLPRSVSEVRSFLGLAGGSRRWIRGFSLIAKPLTALLRNVTVEFQLTEAARDAVEELKIAITSTPVLIRLDYDLAKTATRQRKSDNGLIVVGVDSSWMGAGWAVYQIVNGEKHPAIYGSCTFAAAQQNYGQPKTEVYGVFRGAPAVIYCQNTLTVASGMISIPLATVSAWQLPGYFASFSHLVTTSPEAPADPRHRGQQRRIEPRPL